MAARFTNDHTPSLEHVSNGATRLDLNDVKVVAEAATDTPLTEDFSPATEGKQVVFELDNAETVRLPADANLDQVRVNGANLEFVQPDGTILVVENGAVDGIRIILGTVEIPSQTVALLFAANDIDIAAGPGRITAQSSGGNFEVPVGGIGDAFPLGDLLPPTALAFTLPELRELYPSVLRRGIAPDNDKPTIESIVYGVGGRVGMLDEDGLPQAAADSSPLRAGETASSGASSQQINILVQYGNDAPTDLMGSFELLGSANLNGQLQGLDGLLLTFAVEGGAIVGRSSTGEPLLTISLSGATRGGNGAVTYTLEAQLLGPIQHATQGEDLDILANIAFRVTDGLGDQASSTLTFEIADDMPSFDAERLLAVKPLAADETHLNTEHTANFASAFEDAVEFGADGKASLNYALKLSGPSFGSGLYALDASADNGKGAEILLSQSGNVISGKVGDVTYFEITINPDTGTVTLVQKNALWHADTTNPDDTQTLSAAPEAISIIATATDRDGDKASHSLDLSKDTFAFKDDGPLVVADTDSIASGSYAPATGNVLTDAEGDGGKDNLGADGGTVVGVVKGSTASAPADNPPTQFAIDGNHGKLTLNADGTYTYDRNAGSKGGVSDVFTYTVKDGDGDLASTTLTITIGDGTPTVSIPQAGGKTTTVYEAGLPARDGETEGTGEAIATGANGDPREAVSGTITFTSPDGLRTISLGGKPLTTSDQTFNTDVGGVQGTLTARYEFNAATGAGTIHYTYTLTDNTSGDNTAATFPVVITDLDGDAAPAGNLVIKVVDDAPILAADTDSIANGSYAPATGNVLTDAEGDGGKDNLGADGGTVVGVVKGSTASAPADNPPTQFAIDGNHGKLTLNADGTYTYDRNAGTPGGVSDVFTYTVKDGDGDLANTTLTITIGDGTPTVSIPQAGEKTTTVYEAGLPARNGETEGTGEAIAAGANGDPREAVSGTITFTSPDGLRTISLGGNPLTTSDQTFNTTVDGVQGTLTARYEFNASTGSGTIHYSYTLTDNTSGDNTAASFPVVITDLDGDAAPAGNLVIKVVDDAPILAADTDSIANGSYAPATGNVLTDAEGDGGKDNLGADGGTVVGVVKGSTASAPADNPPTQFAIDGNHGKLTLNADGTYTYDRNAGSEGGVSDVFTYTVKDGDGDLASTTLTIKIGDATPTITNLVPSQETTSVTVYEEALSKGTNPSSDGEAATGSFTINSPDGFATLTIDGNAIITNGVFTSTSFTTPMGNTMAITGYNPTTGVVTYKYTLTNNEAHTSQGNDAITETLAVRLVDQDGDVATGNFTAKIVDDMPIAKDDTGTLEIVYDKLGVGAINAAWKITGGGQNLVYTDQDGDGLSDHVTWGDSSGRSGYGFVDAPAADLQNLLTNQTFYLGEFTHRNLPVTSGTAITQAQLTVNFQVIINGQTVNVGPVVITFTHNETPNSTDPEASRDIISIATSTTTITIAGQKYTLDVTGFVDENNQIVNTVRTYEGQSNTYQLAVRLVSSDTTNITANGNLLSNADTAGADGGLAVVALIGTGAADTTLENGVYQVQGLYGTLTVNRAGEYKYTLTKDASEVPTGAKEVFIYRITDGDGDTDEATFTLDISKVDSNGQIITAGQTINGTAGPETLTGTVGNDIIDGKAGSDTTNAGDGNDIIIADSNDTLIDGGSGIDTLRVSGTFRTASNAQLVNFERVELAAPTSGNRTIADLTNQTESLRITGSSGNDKILGGSGNDVIIGGSGNDILAGGAGNDIVTGGTGADQFRLSSNSGTDVLRDFNRFQSDKIGFLDTGTSASGSVNFANTTGTSAGAVLNRNDFVARSSMSNIDNSDDQRVIVISTAQSEATIKTGSVTSANNSYVIVYNSTSEHGEIWFATNWSVPSTRTLIATLENVISAAEVSALTASNFVVYSDANDPIILDLDGNGVGFSSLSHGVVFDLNGDGAKDKLAWSNTSDGILVYDGNENGIADDGTELFTPWFQGGSFVSGADALASLDSNGDGIISPEDEAFSKLRIWQDDNGDGFTDAGELKTLVEHGITSIDASTSSTGQEIDGQTVVGTGTFTRDDGTTGTYVEVELDTEFGDGDADDYTQAEDDLASSLAATQAWTDGEKAAEARSDMDASASLDEYMADDTLDITELLDRATGQTEASSSADNNGTIIEVNSADLDKLIDTGPTVTVVIEGQEYDVNLHNQTI
ncbi:choice-of-anchor K domain-containing protein [Devosia sp. MC532]|uniref:DUF5801 repeats-in-toxin domain-containing protein n=1 Tax=Devosia sp. MC532 TaxID=2799788 RepID=UPI0018F4EE9A|nr:DUF5801 repeats-in-toxin domain-containing protein [Devosia sp. MC532]MBJ7576779.1 choice-of-anchor K domain-containing protein [Devosia sp. MC532]